MKSTILNLGINNIKSIKSACEKICDTTVISSSNEFTSSDLIILPGMDHSTKVCKKLIERF